MKQINFGNRIRKRLVASAIQAYTAINYPKRNYPYYSGDYAAESSQSPETLTVVSYNIAFAKNIAQAVRDMQELTSQREFDIILLQEMDELGTEQIARDLQMNYVYFPAAIEPTYHKNFGNAILSRWPIVDPQKLILPHKSFSNRMNRIATRAIIRMSGVDILVYSIHTESVFTLPQYRQDQYKAVIDNIEPDARLVIVGGDFNSYTKAAVQQLEADYKRAGFLRASESSGPTIAKFGIELTIDHIFTKGFTVEEADELAGATASDHLPIWVTLMPKNKQTH